MYNILNYCGVHHTLNLLINLGQTTQIASVTRPYI